MYVVYYTLLHVSYGLYYRGLDNISVPNNTGFYGDKILYKNLKFFDKIFVPTFCRRRFRYAPYWEKILKDGEMLCLGMVSTNLFRLFYAGEIQNLNCRRLEMATYSGIFFFTRGCTQTLLLLLSSHMLFA